MSTRVDELIESIRELSKAEREEFGARIRDILELNPFVPVEELRRQYDGVWVVLELPEGEDSYDPKMARLIGFGETDAEACEAADATGYAGVMHFYYFGPDPMIAVPMFYSGDVDEVQIAE